MAIQRIKTKKKKQCRRCRAIYADGTKLIKHIRIVHTKKIFNYELYGGSNL